jgi:hypothetical protein
MALSPIQLFRSVENSLAQILQGGNQTVSGIMDRAIQLGRDISNKQLSQEQDLTQMRQQQLAFDQRRAENAQQDYEDAQKFARGAFESDRNYGLQVKQEERANAKDLFNMQNDAARTDLARQDLGLSKARFEMEKTEAERKRTDAEAERKRLSNIFAPAPVAAAAAAAAAPPTEFVGPPRPPTRPDVGIAATDGMSTDDRLRAQNRVNPLYRRNDPAALLTPPGQSSADPQRVEALFSVLDSPEATTSQKLRAKDELARMSPEGAKPLTESERLAGERLKISQAKEERSRRDVEIESVTERIKQLSLDTESFPLWGGETAEDKAWDDPNRRPFLEITAAEDYESAQAYADAWGKNSGKKPPAHVAKKRKEVWEAARRLKTLRGVDGGSGSSGGGSATPPSASDYIKSRSAALD